MEKELEFLLSPITVLSGFGSKTITIYKKLLISKKILNTNKEPSIVDLIYHKPEKTIYTKENPNLIEVEDGDFIITNAIVDYYEKPENDYKPHKIRCSNNTGFITIVYFRVFPNFIEKNFVIGSNIFISGKAERFNNELQITHPNYVEKELINIPKFEKIYPLTFGLTNRMLSKTIQNTLKQLPNLPEWLNLNILNKYKWKSWKNSILELHNTKTMDDIFSYNLCIERLAFDEIFANFIALALIRKKIKNSHFKTKLENKSLDLKSIFLKLLPFELTKDQNKTIAEIEKDIYSNTRMLRLLQGDVGSGKTIVAFLTMLPFIENNQQIALMVPTSILASQHYEWIKNICNFASNNIKREIKVEILTGKITGKKRQNILNKLENGEVDILIGTHAIFQEKIKFKNLGYAIIDEQHRFGVSQRLQLIEKGENIDILIMTATPIPRTLSLTIYGDIEISTILEKPKNRKEIITTSLQKERLNDLLVRIRKKIKDGEKIYWICPLIEESEFLSATPLFERYEKLRKEFKEEDIGFIHGKLTENEKDKIMEEFGKESSSIKILISTTVIEVGIDVPSATIIIIENPERFGLSQMHQLRGRVGRGDRQSYCILFYEKLTENLKKRMNILKNSSNGFEIAEEDLKLRGSGEVLGSKQSGYSEYLIANLETHYHLMQEASKLAKEIANDTNLLNSHSIKILLQMFGYDECFNEAILN